RPQHRTALRAHADRLGPELRERVAEPEGPVRRAFPAHLALLPALVGRSVPRPLPAAVPDRDDPTGHPAARVSLELRARFWSVALVAPWPGEWSEGHALSPDASLPPHDLRPHRVSRARLSSARRRDGRPVRAVRLPRAARQRRRSARLRARVRALDREALPAAPSPHRLGGVGELRGHL